MKPIDFAKAAGIAVAIMAINVIISIIAVLFYSFFIDPGHPREYYDAAAQRIAPWCSHIGGTALFFLAAWWFARRAPQRNGYIFAATSTVLYAIIDLAIVGFVGALELQLFLSLIAKFLAGQAGAFLAIRKRSTIP